MALGDTIGGGVQLARFLNESSPSPDEVEQARCRLGPRQLASRESAGGFIIQNDSMRVRARSAPLDSLTQSNQPCSSREKRATVW